VKMLVVCVQIHISGQSGTITTSWYYRPYVMCLGRQNKDYVLKRLGTFKGRIWVVYQDVVIVPDCPLMWIWTHTTNIFTKTCCVGSLSCTCGGNTNWRTDNHEIQ